MATTALGAITTPTLMYTAAQADAQFGVLGTGWLITGNSGTVDGTNFIGTTDNIPLSFYVNNQKSGRIDHLLDNTFFGSQSGILITSGTDNTAQGFKSLFKVITGANNTAQGSFALFNTTGSNNTGMGYNAGATNTTGSLNTLIGQGSDVGSGALSYASAIGANAKVNISNALALGGTGSAVVNVGINNAAPGNKLSINTPTTADALAEALISTRLTTQKALVLQDIASQTANIFEIQNSSGTIFTYYNTNLAAQSSSHVYFNQSVTLTDGDNSLTQRYVNKWAVDITNNNPAGTDAWIGGYKFDSQNSAGANTTIAVIKGLEFNCTLNSAQNIAASGFIGVTSKMLSLAGQTGTIADAYNIQILAPTWSGSKPTTNYGLQIANQGNASTTTSYAIDIAAQSGSTNNFGIRCNSNIVSNHATAGIGYTTGAGGTVTQATSKTTAFTLSKITGQITFAAGSLAADTTASATWTNTAIAATDVVVFSHVSGGTIGAYTFNAQAGAGSATINIHNVTPGALNEQPVVQFVVIKGVTA